MTSISRSRPSSKTRKIFSASLKTFSRRSLAHLPRRAVLSVFAPIHWTVRTRLGLCGRTIPHRRPRAHQKGLSLLRGGERESSRRSPHHLRRNSRRPHEILVSDHVLPGRRRRTTCSPRHLPATRLHPRLSLALRTSLSTPRLCLSSAITSKVIMRRRLGHLRRNRSGRAHHRTNSCSLSAPNVPSRRATCMTTF